MSGGRTGVTYISALVTLFGSEVVEVIRGSPRGGEGCDGPVFATAREKVKYVGDEERTRDRVSGSCRISTKLTLLTKNATSVNDDPVAES